MDINHESNKFIFINRVPRSMFVKSEPRSALNLDFFIDSNLRVEYEYGYEYEYK
jgi:hypothetical protein